MTGSFLKGMNPLFAAMLVAAMGCSSPSEPAEPARETVVQVKGEEPAPDTEERDEPADHDHDDDHDHGDGGEEHDDEHHHHEPPHGGTMVELGDHQGNIEFVLDKENGVLTMYALDAHAEGPVRLKDELFLISIHDDGGRFMDLRMEAVANELTGETVGDSSEFRAQSEDLKTFDRFTIMLPAFEFRGMTFPAMNVQFPGGDSETHEVPAH